MYRGLDPTHLPRCVRTKWKAPNIPNLVATSTTLTSQSPFTEVPGRLQVAVVLTQNFYIRSWQVESYVTCGTLNYTGPTLHPLEVTCWPRPPRARFAAIKVLSSHVNVSLSLCEVEVYNASKSPLKYLKGTSLMPERNR